MKKGFCHHCGNELEFVEKVFRNDTCDKCGSDVYCCLNCSNYDESVADQCDRTPGQRVSVKDRRNFCEYLTLREGRASGTAAQKAAESRKKLEALFKK